MEHLPIIIVVGVLLPVLFFLFIGLAIFALRDYLPDNIFRKCWEFYYKNLDVSAKSNVNSEGKFFNYFLWVRIRRSKYWDTTAKKFDVTKQGATRWLRRRGLTIGEDKNSLIAPATKEKFICRATDKKNNLLC